MQRTALCQLSRASFFRPGLFCRRPVPDLLALSRSRTRPVSRKAPRPTLRRSSPQSYGASNALEPSRDEIWEPESSEEFKQGMLRNTLDWLDPEEAYRVYVGYREAELNASKPLSVEWKRRFIKGHNIEPSFLYDVGCVAFTLLWGRDFPTESARFAMRLIGAAGELGHVPAALSLLKHLHTRKLDLASNYPALWAVFQSVLKKEEDPNALTLQGILLEKKGDLHEATTVLRVALETGRTLDAADFQWKADCMLHLGTALQKLGEHKQARDVFKVLSLMDHREGFYHLGMLDKKHPDAKAHLEQAAVSGVAGAVMALAELEAEAFKNATEVGDAKTAARCLADSQEWLRLHRAWAYEHRKFNPNNY